MPLYKDERELISKNISPKLKELNYNCRLGVRLKAKYQKLRTEDVLSVSEVKIKNLLSPDIDILYWPRDYTGEPEIHAAEVKYFRLDKNKDVHPSIYDGVGEALVLCTYGVDYVHLWHFFDPEVSNELFERHKNTIESIFNKIYTINYRCEMLTKPPKLKPSEKESLPHRIEILLEGLKHTNLNRNSLRYDDNAQVIRRIIKKSYRLV